MNCRYLLWTLSQFDSRNSFTQILDILSSRIRRTLCIYFALLEVLVVLPLKDLETKLCMPNQKEVVTVHYIKVFVNGVLKRFCLCRNFRREFILSITFKAIDSPERLSSKIHRRYFTFACCLISMPLYTMFKDLAFQSYV